MPVLTRASSRNPSPSLKKATIPSMLNPTGSEVIIISDDEEPIRKSSSGGSSGKARNKRKAPPPSFVDGDVLEIMSTDEEDARTHRSPSKKSATDSDSEVVALKKKLKLVQMVRGSLLSLPM